MSTSEPATQRKCRSCGNLTTNKTSCTDCNKAIGVLAKQRRDRRREQGLCPQCGKQPTDGRLCDGCFQKMKITRQKPRLDCLRAYGGTCQCCGETQIEFLQIDHKTMRGFEERDWAKKQGLPADLFRRLKKLGYPDDYQVLCANCNQAIGFYGYCPHKPDNKRTTRRPHMQGRLTTPAYGK